MTESATNHLGEYVQSLAPEVVEQVSGYCLRNAEQRYTLDHCFTFQESQPS